MSFSDLIGNEAVKKILKAFARKRKLPHALLFTGEDGVGKKSFAIELVRALFCQNQIDGESCSICHACKKIRLNIPSEKEDFKKVIFSSHGDFGVVLPQNKVINVDAIRDLEMQTRLKPLEAQMRIFIIDEAEKMTSAASNALLKTLEEPPSTSHVILISSHANLILPTILSRCQILSFAPVDFKEMAVFLSRKRKIPLESAQVLARCAKNVSKALAVDIEEFFERRKQVLEVFKASVNSDFVTLLGLTEGISDSIEEFLELMHDVAHDLWIIKLGISDKISNTDLESQLRTIAERVNEKTILTWLEEIEELRKAMQVNPNKKIASDALFVKMTYG
ncbi:MAG: AAA family ATPase [Pyrinomonadaceae bacterium]|nr:AAA family ATPase [Pyrinomonadaceae bacterium]MCX7640248.1 AAA family ATPase [Pyrinomonadaceae bacterium]MDW8305128.1 DNA polymerase III subunit delta' C-terminal domain-containing protein [Acidobacteriota bacterium]